MERAATISRIESVIEELPDDKLINLWKLMVEVLFEEDSEPLAEETIREIKQARREISASSTS